jgi:hypothetical protein
MQCQQVVEVDPGAVVDPGDAWARCFGLWLGRGLFKQKRVTSWPRRLILAPPGPQSLSTAPTSTQLLIYPSQSQAHAYNYSTQLESAPSCAIMSPTAPCCAHACADPIPRTPSAVHNLAHLGECCKHSCEADTSGIVHPHPAFMERAIYLSRVAGLEKRTGECVWGPPGHSMPAAAAAGRSVCGEQGSFHHHGSSTTTQLALGCLTAPRQPHQSQHAAALRAACTAHTCIQSDPTCTHLMAVRARAPPPHTNTQAAALVPWW